MQAKNTTRFRHSFMIKGEGSCSFVVVVHIVCSWDSWIPFCFVIYYTHFRRGDIVMFNNIILTFGYSCWQQQLKSSNYLLSYMFLRILKKKTFFSLYHKFTGNNFLLEKTDDFIVLKHEMWCFNKFSLNNGH